jgi:hypothetical protein
VTHDLAEWKDEIAWMSLYFSMAVWASLALCVAYSLEPHLPRYRIEPAVANWSSNAEVAGSKAPAGAVVRDRSSSQGGWRSTNRFSVRGVTRSRDRDSPHSLRPNSQPFLA